MTKITELRPIKKRPDPLAVILGTETVWPGEWWEQQIDMMRRCGHFKPDEVEMWARHCAAAGVQPCDLVAALNSLRER